MAKLFIILGVIFLTVGIVLYMFPSLFSWFGKLPGDIVYTGQSSKVFIPIASMIVLSIVLSILLNLFKR